jgi:VanZ family protein
VPDQRLRFRRLWLGLGCVLVLVVVYLSLTPDPVAELPGANGDKFGHMLSYATLMLWFAQIYRGQMARIALAVAFVCMGISLEYLQLLVVTRTFDYMDMAANSLGTLSAYVVSPPRLPNFLEAAEALIGRHIKPR